MVVRNIYKERNIKKVMINKNELKELIQDLKDASEGLRISESNIFIEACSYQRGFLARSRRIDRDNKQDPATEKQKNLLYRLNADFDASKITKKEASVLISELKDKK